MIEFLNVVKDYKSKTGNITNALKNVNIKFDSKGMTFILGKSGSGKSTLLNVLGGLDQYDSGDMLILGKSTKNFTQADFDSYRNTYVGFIFQEFNILEDYDVYENIVLALQLQQKKINEDEINSLLERLDLIELKKRKVNELSGGQKQRVAIARALIKNPKIILADEPTGNLDSTTGTQVMQLLKEISNERLVIIVSHDTESARQYGDRVIEIQDGEVIHDTGQVAESVQNEEYQSIKSKLPLKESIKLGLGSLRYKKVRLFFTILLTVFTLVFYSLLDTISTYDVQTAHAKVAVDEHLKYVQIGKYSYEQPNGEGDFCNWVQLPLEKKDEEKILSSIGDKYYPIYKIKGQYMYASVGALLKIEDREEDTFYEPTGTQFEAEIIPLYNFKELVSEKITGKYPVKPDEILISNYVADLMILRGIQTYEESDKNEFSNEHIFYPKNYDEIINSDKTYFFGNAGRVKITGIINYDLSRYQKLKKVTNDNYGKGDSKLAFTELLFQIKKEMGKIYVTPMFVGSLDVEDFSGLDNSGVSFEIKSDTVNFTKMYTVQPSLLEKKLEYFDGAKWKESSELNSGEIILNINQLLPSNISYLEQLENYVSKYLIGEREERQKRFFENFVKDYNVIGERVDFVVKNQEDKVIHEYRNLKVVGIIPPNTNSSNYFYLSSKQLSEYKLVPTQKVEYLVPMTKYNDFKKMFEVFPYNETISAHTPYSWSVASHAMGIEFEQKLAFWIGTVFLVFTVILISNFITTSIHYRKKEIGVFRALGSRSMDVVKIFMWEGLFISILSGTLGCLFLIGVTNLFNATINGLIPTMLTEFVLGARQFIVIYLIVLVVTTISSILPLMKFSKMKPIDAILNK